MSNLHFLYKIEVISNSDPIIDINLNHLKFMFLLANTTSLILLCDLSIIRAFKAYYRSAIRGKVFIVIDKGLQDDLVLAS